MRTLYTWDHSGRFDDDPCGCPLCKRIQKVVNSRNPGKELNDWYRLLEDLSRTGRVTVVEKA